jgi:hypothetical protein
LPSFAVSLSRAIFLAAYSSLLKVPSLFQNPLELACSDLYNPALLKSYTSPIISNSKDSGSTLLEIITKLSKIL